jgi:hypothetical protein
MVGVHYSYFSIQPIILQSEDKPFQVAYSKCKRVKTNVLTEISTINLLINFADTLISNFSSITGVRFSLE